MRCRNKGAFICIGAEINVDEFYTACQGNKQDNAI